MNKKKSSSIKQKKTIVDKVKRTTSKKSNAFKIVSPIEKVKQFVKEKIKSSSSKSKQKVKKEDKSNEAKDDNSSKSSKGEALITFFYTNDKFINQFEDKEIVTEIQKKYSKFMAPGITDSELKKTIASLVQDKEFVTDLLSYYNMSIFDFFKFIFRLETGIFRGAFLTKIGRLVDEAGYDFNVKR